MTYMADSTIDERKIAEARQKLACHIAPPEHASSDEGGPGGRASRAQDDFLGEDGRVYLTRMTAAGG